MKELIDYLQKEWGTLSGAPATFLIGWVLVASLAYTASRWKHGATIDTLRERLAKAEGERDAYKERLDLVPAYGSLYSRLSHVELQKETLKFASGLRVWLDVHQSKSFERQRQQRFAMMNATDEVQRHQLWEAETEDSMRSSMVFSNEYDVKFKGKSLALRDELMTRVSHPDPSNHARCIYGHPTNLIGMGMVADDLERMARLLK
ncbi:hypothetical protein [Collimonas pratensis]|uniref:hypothetical protein n=1 Tax=Collimonas pratensis TaxID=279113 RepID=UPI000782D9AE|nr:hypothetical protein [Collimonas pratensis]